MDASMMEIPALDDVMFARGLVSPGLSGPLERFRAKLDKREPVVYAAIGGSITAGALASDGERTSYGALFAAWLNERAPCTFINAGLGATTSLFGAFRAQQDMLCREPDIVTIEFAVNDSINPDIAASYEALVRQCVNSPKKPLVILIFNPRRDGTNYQHDHIPIGRHYALPMLSFRDAIYPEIAAGKLCWEAISPDEVHPNDGGHAFIAALLERFVGSVSAPAGDAELPELLSPSAAKYLDGKVLYAPNMEVVENDGWTQFTHARGYVAWESERPGACLKVRLTGGTLLIGYVKYAGDYGMADVRIGGETICRLDGFYEKPEIQKWAGGHTVPVVLCDEAPGTTRVVEITLATERHAQSGGHRFQISYFLTGQ